MRSQVSANIVASSAAIVVAVVLLLPQAEAARAFFVFGDSLVDNGNNNYLLTTARADSPPYGIDYPTHRPTGRFSNGYNIPDLISKFVICTMQSIFPHFICIFRDCSFAGPDDILHQFMNIGQALGAESTLPYLSPELNGEKLLVGANFASAGIGILNDTGIQFVSSDLRSCTAIFTELLISCKNGGKGKKKKKPTNFNCTSIRYPLFFSPLSPVALVVYFSPLGYLSWLDFLFIFLPLPLQP